MTEFEEIMLSIIGIAWTIGIVLVLGFFIFT